MSEKANGVTEGGRNLLNNKHVIVICDSIQVKHALIKILHLYDTYVGRGKIKLHSRQWFDIFVKRRVALVKSGLHRGGFLKFYEI